MRIAGPQDEVLTDVWMSLTYREALDLRASLDYLLSEELEEGWHAHVLCEDGMTELTISREDDPEATADGTRRPDAP